MPVTFTPLNGAAPRHDRALCHLLELDGYKILLDCGWTDTFEDADLEMLRQVADEVDCVLLSHGDLEHAGALPYAVKHLGLRGPIFATLPTQRVAEMTLYDILLHRVLREDFDQFGVEDVEKAFSLCTQLKYYQRYKIPEHGVTITAYPAGHTLGGAVWRIVKEPDEIVYAMDYYHRKERILPAVDSANAFSSKPTLLITSARNAARPVPPKGIDRLLTEKVMEVLRREGNVLIPSDTAGRMLEVLMLLGQHWETHRITLYSLVVLSNTSTTTIEFARTMLEWMNDNVSRNFDLTREDPLRLEFVRFITRTEDLKTVKPPMVVLASPVSMNTGFSLDLFAAWAWQPKNCIIFVERGPEGCVAQQILKEYSSKVGRQGSGGVLPQVCIDVVKRVPLEGDELRDWEEREREREAEEARRRREEQDRKRIMIIRDEEEEPPVPLDEPVVLPPPGKGDSRNRKTAPLPLPVLPRHAGLFLPRTLGYSSRHLMFPCRERKPQKVMEPYGASLPPELCEVMQQTMEKEFATQIEPVTYASLDQVIATNARLAYVKALPTKPVRHTQTIAIYCTVWDFDLEGQPDGFSVKCILTDKKFNPKKLILTNGSEENLRLMLNYCYTVCADVFTPSIGERVDASSNVNLYRIKMRDELLSRLQFQRVKECDIAFIEGEVLFTNKREREFAVKEEEEESNGHVQQEAMNKRKRLENLNMNDRDLPVVYPITDKLKGRGHPSVLLGDVTLAKFAAELVQRGWRTEFREGCLICNDKVVCRMKPNTPGDISVEGMVCPEFFQIRELLCAQFRML
eukprot:TRINITY_DN41553_c0_g1_i1.p1 TRINITY_DN41553_c0_g1~~TRINITY_DN41553_c0_g1_i1.p1  ORF type:complete len:799 (+),score=131.41 TRINITY_DN41553_c0_g1_i1:92-2488(+)